MIKFCRVSVAEFFLFQTNDDCFTGIDSQHGSTFAVVNGKKFSA